MRRFDVGFVFLLAAAACSGSPTHDTTRLETTTTASTSTIASSSTTAATGFLVVSEDGDVTVEVPLEALAEDPGIVIRRLAPEEFPPELAGAAQQPNSRIYQLEPHGLVFDAPVRVERRLDAASFADLGETEVPIVSLVIRADDGTYELFDDIHVMRSGDDVLVSGEITHFSPVVTLYERQKVSIDIDRRHSVFATEQDTTAMFGISFYGSDGTRLNRPDVQAWGRSRSDFLTFAGDGELQITCSGIGEAKPRLGFRVELRADAPIDYPRLLSAPTLIPGLEAGSYLLKIAHPFACLDPIGSLIGRPLEFSAQVDHPGGDLIVPGEDFRGGLSGLIPRIRGEFPMFHIGLIGDSDGNGQPDGDDRFYPPVMTVSTGSSQEAVIPLFGYGTYFAYVIDARDYDPVPDLSDSMTLEQAMFGLWQSYSRRSVSDGRFETSFGVIGDTTGPFVFMVGPQETRIEERQATIQSLYGLFPLSF